MAHALIRARRPGQWPEADVGPLVQAHAVHSESRVVSGSHREAQLEDGHDHDAVVGHEPKLFEPIDRVQCSVAKMRALARRCQNALFRSTARKHGSAPKSAVRSDRKTIPGSGSSIRTGSNFIGASLALGHRPLPAYGGTLSILRHLW